MKLTIIPAAPFATQVLVAGPLNVYHEASLALQEIELYSRKSNVKAKINGDSTDESLRYGF